MTHEAKHTPGPWSLNNWPQGDAELRIGAMGVARIATIHLRDVSINQQKANAALMIAAPDMLAALIAVQDDYRELLRSGPTNEEADEIDAMLQIIDAAIAKATGAA